MNKLGPYDLNQIITGDAKELCKAIPDNSVDLIFTDPVYDRIEDYEWLAGMASRVLRDGGSVVAQCGSIYRFRAECAMSQSSLFHMPMLFDYYEFARNPLYVYKINVNVKPYIWFSQGKPKQYDWVFLATKYYRAMGRLKNGRPAAKLYHNWGDFLGYYLRKIKALTSNASVVLDPFTGGGTVPAVCKQLSRPYLAFEIDPDTAEAARQRVANTQPPLIVPQAEQMEMAIT